MTRPRCASQHIPGVVLTPTECLTSHVNGEEAAAAAGRRAQRVVVLYRLANLESNRLISGGKRTRRVQKRLTYLDFGGAEPWETSTMVVDAKIRL
jgi:hypothetical protein